MGGDQRNQGRAVFQQARPFGMPIGESIFGGLPAGMAPKEILNHINH
jgi:hypothetical protein